MWVLQNKRRDRNGKKKKEELVERKEYVLFINMLKFYRAKINTTIILNLQLIVSIMNNQIEINYDNWSHSCIDLK